LHVDDPDTSSVDVHGASYVDVPDASHVDVPDASYVDVPYASHGGDSIGGGEDFEKAWVASRQALMLVTR